MVEEESFSSRLRTRHVARMIFQRFHALRIHSGRTQKFGRFDEKPLVRFPHRATEQFHVHFAHL